MQEDVPQHLPADELHPVSTTPISEVYTEADVEKEISELLHQKHEVFLLQEHGLITPQEIQDRCKEIDELIEKLRAKEEVRRMNFDQTGNKELLQERGTSPDDQLIEERILT